MLGDLFPQVIVVDAVVGDAELEGDAAGTDDGLVHEHAADRIQGHVPVHVFLVDVQLSTEDIDVKVRVAHLVGHRQGVGQDREAVEPF